ncbi:unnamed protein product [Ilex paraguariensis]|uniref:Diphthamide biosynthesis protein 3 n=1 Tax=Ilex paraguariensis TaxID=185542 RepID=A0ABC8S1Z8_9AQUA
MVAVEIHQSPVAQIAQIKVWIEDMEWNEELQAFMYPHQCRDIFQITEEDLRLFAWCPSCSLYITVVYNVEDFLVECDPKSKKNIEPSKQQPVAVD